jgi:hypothetical protein
MVFPVRFSIPEKNLRSDAVFVGFWYYYVVMARSIVMKPKIKPSFGTDYLDQEFLVFDEIKGDFES